MNDTKYIKYKKKYFDLLNKLNKQKGGYFPEKIKNPIYLNFNYLLYDKDLPNQKYDDYLNTEKINEDLKIFLKNESYENKNKINIFSMIFNQNHPNFKSYLKDFKIFTKSVLEIITKTFMYSKLIKGDKEYDTIIDGDLTYLVKPFYLSEELPSGFLNQILLTYKKTFNSNIVKTKIMKNSEDDTFKNYYYFYDSFSDDKPIFSIDENNYFLSKKGKNKFKDNVYMTYIKLFPIIDIPKYNEELNKVILTDINPDTPIDTLIRYRNNFISKNKLDTKLEYRNFNIDGGKIGAYFETPSNLYYKAIALVPTNNKIPKLENNEPSLFNI